MNSGQPAASSSAAEPGHDQPRGSNDRLTMRRDAVVDMPAELRLRAKRGDTGIHLV